MTLPDGIAPRDFLRAGEFSEGRTNARYSNARRVSLGGLFVSYSGIDTPRIRDDIIRPVVFHRLPADGYFMHSRTSGGADAYRELVLAALHWCDKFMVVISEMSIANEWVHAEVEWAIERSRPILAVSIDGCTWNDLAQKLQLPAFLGTVPGVQYFDLSRLLEKEQRRLATALDELLAKFPRRGLPER